MLVIQFSLDKGTFIEFSLDGGITWMGTDRVIPTRPSLPKPIYRIRQVTL